MEYDLSIVIPAKNEPYLIRTVQDVFEHAETDIEVLVGLDGITQDEATLIAKDLGRGVILIANGRGIGQRAMTNALVSQAKAEFIMKIDAHCTFSQGFDKELLSKMDENTIMAPYLLPLDAEKWMIKPAPKTSVYGFDTNLVMQYLSDLENSEPINETMCLQGSAWVVSRLNYWNWNLGEESLGAWGMQGTELGIKAFLNGGVCKTNKLCHYGHLFRHKEEEFPYKRDLKAIEDTKDRFVKKFKTKALRSLIEKYNYPFDWTPEEVEKLT